MLLRRVVASRLLAATEIGVGGYVGPTALLLWDSLSSNQSAAATAVLGRSSYKGETGANLVWQAGNVLMAGLFRGNRTTVADAVAASFTVIVLAPGSTEGMKAGTRSGWSESPCLLGKAARPHSPSDGAFFQHGAQLYNGGYGQSFSYDSELERVIRCDYCSLRMVACPPCHSSSLSLRSGQPPRPRR